MLGAIIFSRAIFRLANSPTHGPGHKKRFMKQQTAAWAIMLMILCAMSWLIVAYGRCCIVPEDEECLADVCDCYGPAAATCRVVTHVEDPSGRHITRYDNSPAVDVCADSAAGSELYKWCKFCYDFKDEKCVQSTDAMLRGWAQGLGAAWLIMEPAFILLIVLIPCLCKNKFMAWLNDRLADLGIDPAILV